MSEEIKLCEYYSEHWYKVGEKYYPSITTKLGITRKPFLELWRGDLGNRECNLRLFEAQERGTRIHHAWYMLTTGGAVVFNNWKRPTYTATEIEAIKEKYPEKVAIIQYQDEMIDCWKLQRFMEIVKPKVVASEITLYSEKYQEAGTADNVFEIAEGDYAVNGRDLLYLPGGLYIADLKTGNTFSDDAYLQTSAYASMYQERYRKKIIGTLGLHTNAKTKKGISGFAVYYRSEAEVSKDFQKFRNISRVWEDKNEMEQPKQIEFPSLLTLNMEK